MADGHGGIAILLLHHELSHGLTHNVRAAEDDTLLAAGLNAVTLQQRDDAEGRGRDETRQADGHATYVDGVESVHVLAIVDGFDDFLLRDVLGQWELHDEAIHVGVFVELFHLLKEECQQADIIIAAIGKPNFVTADMVKEGAVIVDVGTTRVPDATRKSGFRLNGDVDFENVAPKCSFITPVPGGVGPMTICSLMKNTLSAGRKEFYK